MIIRTVTQTTIEFGNCQDALACAKFCDAISRCTAFDIATDVAEQTAYVNYTAPEVGEILAAYLRVENV